MNCLDQFPVMTENEDSWIHCCPELADENRIAALNEESGTYIFVDAENYLWTMKKGDDIKVVKSCEYCGKEL